MTEYGIMSMCVSDLNVGDLVSFRGGFLGLVIAKNTILWYFETNTKLYYPPGAAARVMFTGIRKIA